MKKIFKAFKPFLLLALLCVLILIFLFGGNAKNEPIMKKRANELTSNYVGLNMFSGWIPQEGLSPSDGTAQADYNAFRSDFIPVYQNTSMYISYSGTFQNFICFYDMNKSFLNRTAGVMNDARDFYIDNSTYYIRIHCYYNNDLYDPNYIPDKTMLNLGVTPIPYQPYFTTNDIYENGYNDGYDIGFNYGYDDGYDDGYENGSRDGYDVGYDDGYENGFNDTIENFTATPVKNIILSAYLNNELVYAGTQIYYAVDYDDYNSLEGCIYISDISLPDTDYDQLNIELVFEYSVMITSLYSSNGYTTFTNGIDIFGPPSYAGGIGAYYNADLTANSSNFVNITYSGNRLRETFIQVKGTYNAEKLTQQATKEGYEAGYSVGKQDGTENVINNPNDYNLYNQTQYENYGKGQYQAGYDKGINEEAPTGLEWFKSAINVTQAFLDITILPGVSLIHIFSGFIILAILKWVLDWFRG